MFFYDDRIRGLLERVLPGVNWVEYVPKYVKSLDGNDAENAGIVQKMVDYVDNATGDKVKFADIRKAHGIGGSAANRQWRDKLRPALIEAVKFIGWELQGYGLVRT